MSRKRGGCGFGLIEVLCVIVLLLLVMVFVLAWHSAHTQSLARRAPVSALIYTPTGEVKAKVGDLVRVKHKDRFVSKEATPEGLYVIREISTDNVGVVFSFENPSFPDGLPVGENSLEAESDFIQFSVYDPTLPEHKSVKAEFENLALVSSTSTQASARTADTK